jgi:hypothetical protein
VAGRGCELGYCWFACRLAPDGPTLPAQAPTFAHVGRRGGVVGQGRGRLRSQDVVDLARSTPEVQDDCSEALVE